MVLLRSSTIEAVASLSTARPRLPKRASSQDGAASKRAAKKASTSTEKARQTALNAALLPLPQGTTHDSDSAQTIAREPLSFSYSAAREHLIAADPRFGHLMDSLPCKPFEMPEETVSPFRSLCSSILGQQISWLAARSIKYRFIRLWFPDLPEKPDYSIVEPFPTPFQVASASVQHLRSAGLSQRKAEYIQDLASKFVEGWLDAKAMLKMSDEEVMEHLIKVRGIGRWTVEMALIFVFLRPDIMPSGDLGVQKAMLTWFTQANPHIKARKIEQIKPETVKEEIEVPLTLATTLLTPPATPSTSSQGTMPDFALPRTPDTKPNIKIEDFQLHTPLSPAVERRYELPPLPPSKTIASRAVLQARFNKKLKGNIYLSPEEMEELSQSWRPYRSIAVWYLWSLSDGENSSV
ncbi:uncharacterized protein L969DRAFT_15957 [Mixia osmundae IAM 14324]|uniref:HhH-GPD domain-containing protein n=1 Tax=Mixia osmundae (strain CBS 9802 / IAM 14324 / JCM 22182 / KY 12970) TaxID=764103 RepID=G7E5Z0_MIXOS|nr:uncharacterized protein L969DRAFT_15957 [Mixia osmundae IAM 14324]KEI40600.1 hypothetical protein L969DRAFT_15957 [Mixia osmundae IAM 14324]GAA98250.1 hypothetical protein E5Q_04933 [Mixia osmundae IAM 14324]